ncbi:GTPase IMAP family member 7 [Labeo rohita]|uniref:GTPase IMAP family member 7 n=1 Tax=Labeo rohita TaxID=84645 RepID=A0ABQ8MW41_LABRO|nr:GTPase IMAP family member 7 [Labeo rohita]
MILFTHGDKLEYLDEPQTTDEYLQTHEDLQRLVQELLQKIERMLEENGGIFSMEQMKRSDGKNTVINFSGESSVDEDLDGTQIPEKTNQIRLVLLGKTGAGKDVAGNTIIGKRVFESSMSSNSQTKQCQSETIDRMGKTISVIDTPGLYDNVLSEEEEKKNTIKELEEVFGEKLEKYAMIIFTHKDQLEKQKKTIDEFLQNADPDLKKLVKGCGN